MITFEHKQLLKRILDVDTRSLKPPDDPVEKEAWFSHKKHLELLRANAKEGELIVFAQTKNLLVNSIIVRKSQLIPLDLDDMLEWQGNAYTVRAGYSYSSRYEDPQVKLEYYNADCSNNTFRNAEQLVFVRDSGDIAEHSHYCEILQDYLHASEIYWSSFHNAYCCFDELGDLIPVVSITNDQRGNYQCDLVSFRRESLERYLTVTDSVLVRMFEVMIYDESKVYMRDNSTTFKNVYPSNDFFYKKLVDPLVQTWTKGVQIIYPVTPKPIVLLSIINNKFYFSISEEYVEFIALDFRNKRISTISTDPRATTNYFEAKENNLPFETSIAFFKAEVLQKYKNNPEKYKIKDNRVMCRNIWVLEYAINEAGQVHVYMIRLRGIPYKEQLYWKSFNEPPEAGISERTYKTDFLGEWLDEEEATALEKMRYILDQWARSDSKWWRLRDTTLLDSVTVPYDENYKEWYEEFAKISKYVIEPLNEKHIKKILDANDTNYGDNWKSLQLIEALLQNKNLLKENEKLIGLREARYIRNKAHSHLEGRDATRIKNQALRDHGSYAGHFEHVCTQIIDELKLIQKVFTQDGSSTH